MHRKVEFVIDMGEMVETTVENGTPNKVSCCTVVLRTDRP